MLFALLLASHMVVSRFSIGQFAPLTFISLRLIFTALATGAVYRSQPKRKLPRDPKLWLTAGIYGVFATAMPLAAFVSAMQYQSSGVASLLGTLNTAFTVVFAQLFLEDEKLSWNKAAGVLVAFGGAALLILRGETGLVEIVKADWRGYAWVGLALLGISGGPVYVRRFMRSTDLFDVAIIRMVVAGAVSIPITLLTTGYDFSTVQWSGYLALLFAAIFGTFFAFHLEFYIIQRFGATPVSQSSYYTPVFTTIMGVIFLGELITPIIALGMLVIFAGVALINRKSRTGD